MFYRGLYLAGVECRDDAEAPEGWTKWRIPGYEYIYAENDSGNTFPEMIQYLQDNHIPLAGAVHDFTCPKTGKSCLFFPIRSKNPSAIPPGTFFRMSFVRHAGQINGK